MLTDVVVYCGTYVAVLRCYSCLDELRLRILEAYWFNKLAPELNRKT